MNIIDRTPAMQAHFKDINHECRAIEAGKRPLFSQRDQLIIQNYRVAITIAAEYQGNGLPMEELIGYAYIGLCKAADRFDPTKGIDFAVYAYWWVRMELKEGLTKTGHAIRLPKHKQQLLRSVKQLQSAFFLQHGRDPQPCEIAELLDQKESLILDLLAAAEPMQPLPEEETE